MDKQEFKDACYEVLEILKYVKKEDLEKIPKEEIKILKEYANYNHNFQYDPNKHIKEQEVLKLTKGIIAQYFYQYTATDKQKEKIRPTHLRQKIKRPQSAFSDANCDLQHFCSLVCAECDNPAYFAGTVCQMFFAYSFSALSAANLPEQAVFIRDIEFQRVLSAQSSSILFCA